MTEYSLNGVAAQISSYIQDLQNAVDQALLKLGPDANTQQMLNLQQQINRTSIGTEAGAATMKAAADLMKSLVQKFS
jgi:hypothetical protein